ncbi:hypothetical protein ACKC9G_06790 [Pokkaliibacter sp. CJK22405]|uniref:hypothetical protein n=1 Tax=Pokkaliibacter sp. CJK22405 TaxID=3384615 RepID=UPI003984ECA9
MAYQLWHNTAAEQPRLWHPTEPDRLIFERYFLPSNPAHNSGYYFDTAYWSAIARVVHLQPHQRALLLCPVTTEQTLSQCDTMLGYARRHLQAHWSFLRYDQARVERLIADEGPACRQELPRLQDLLITATPVQTPSELTQLGKNVRLMLKPFGLWLVIAEREMGEALQAALPGFSLLMEEAVSKTSTEPDAACVYVFTHAG